VSDQEARSDTLALQCEGLHKRYGAVVAAADVSFTVGRGELLALLGPSGCGKTTTLRLIAGFERLDAGRIVIAGHEVDGPARHVPPERRHVGMVFQDYALFPHLTVAANVAYGTRTEDGDAPGWLRRTVARSRGGTSARGAEVLELVGLHHLNDRYPHELSGGEAQRVALARALAPRPDLILLDEPFSNLDARLRASVRGQVRAILHRAGASAVFVTHDQEEAFSLADRVAVMHRGRIEQVGTPAEIYRAPATRFVAGFVGDADFLPGEVQDGGALTEVGWVRGTAPDGARQVDVVMRPEAFRVEASAEPDAGVVVDREYYGHDQLLAVRLASGQVLRVRLGPSDEYAPGDRVRLEVRGDATLFARAD
jgi:iron(III) transport system ATP-binding protein